MMKSNLNTAELSMILYYADLLSLKQTSTTVTDNCKYFFVYGMPINAAFIADTEPFYDALNRFFLRSLTEYQQLKNKLGEEAVKDFLSNICNIGTAGMVNALQMLKYIHRYSEKEQRSRAFKQYKKFKKLYIYTIPIIDENGNEQRRECTPYIAHTTKGGQRTRIQESV